MPQKTDAELTTEAQVIRDETTELANTKTRVYDILKNIIDSKPNNTGNHWRGSWASTTTFPADVDNVGSDSDGDILAGDMFVFTNQVSAFSSVFPAKSVIIALQNTPTTLAHWTVLAPQS